MPISSDSSPDGELVSSLKTSRHALLSKLSEMAPATVPAASRLECSDDAPQATVELRLTPLMRILRRSRVLLRSALASHCLSLVIVRCFHPSPRRAARDGGRAPGPALSLSAGCLYYNSFPPHRRARGSAVLASCQRGLAAAAAAAAKARTPDARVGLAQDRGYPIVPRWLQRLLPP